MTKLADKIFAREEHTCPWWFCFTFDNPARGLLQNPFRILQNYVKKNDTILDIGPGMGYFTFPMSQMAGENGKVVALDIQEGMLKRLGKKVLNKGIENIKIHLYDGVKFNLNEKFDFVLLFWMFHEVKNKPEFINEIRSLMKDSAQMFIAEPKIHVDKKRFDASVNLLISEGFEIIEEPRVSLSRAVVLRKK